MDTNIKNVEVIAKEEAQEMEVKQMESGYEVAKQETVEEWHKANIAENPFETGITETPKEEATNDELIDEIDDSTELGTTEACIWNNLKALGVLNPTYGMKSVGGDFSNLYALIKNDGEKKKFVVTGMDKNGNYETVELEFFGVYEVSRCMFNMIKICSMKNTKAASTASKAEQFYSWINQCSYSKITHMDFLKALWTIRTTLPLRISCRKLTLQMVIGSILTYTSFAKKSYFYTEENRIILKSFDMDSIADVLECSPLEIVKVLNNAGLLIKSNVSGSYQRKKRIDGQLVNVYTVKIPR